MKKNRVKYFISLYNDGTYHNLEACGWADARNWLANVVSNKKNIRLIDEDQYLKIKYGDLSQEELKLIFDTAKISNNLRA